MSHKTLWEMSDEEAAAMAGKIKANQKGAMIAFGVMCVLAVIYSVGMVWFINS